MSASDFSRHVYEVQRSDQAVVLSDAASRRYFKPFLGVEKSVASASREVGCSVETMAYRVKTFVAADLLRLTRVEKRRGRPIKHYRSVADVFFLPLAVMPFTDVEEMLQAQSKPWIEFLLREIAHAIQQAKEVGQYLYRDSVGEVWFSGSPPSETLDSASKVAAVFDSFGELHLTNEEAQNLKQALSRIFTSYSEKSADSRASTKRFGYGVIFTSLR